MGAGLCFVTLYYTWRFPVTSTAESRLKSEKKERAPETPESRMKRRMTCDSMITAAITGTLYWITGLSAILYPGSKAMDPEFGDAFPQAIVFPIFMGMAIVGAWLEVKGLRG